MDKKAFSVLVSTMFISMMGFGVIIPLLPIYAQTLGASGLELGLIAAGFSITHAIFLTFMGRLSDRYGRKIFLCMGLFFITIISLGFIGAKNATHLIILRSLQGIATTMHLPVAQAYLGDLTPEGEEGRWMGFFNAVLFGGVGAGPLLGGAVNDMFGMEAVFLTTSILCFIGLNATITFLAEPSKKTGLKREKLSFLSIKKSGPMKALLTLQLTVGTGLGAIFMFLPILASNKLLLNTSLIGIILASRTPISLLQSYTGRLADRYNRKTLIIGGIFVTLIFMAMLPFSYDFWSLAIIHIIAVLGMSFSQPAATAYVVEAGRAYGMGATMAMFMTAMQIGQGVGPILLGLLVDLLGIDYAFYSGALVNLFGIALFSLMMRNHHGPGPR